MRPHAIPMSGDGLAALPGAAPVSDDGVLTRVELSMTLGMRENGTRGGGYAQCDNRAGRYYRDAYVRVWWREHSQYDAATCTGCSDMDRRAQHHGFFECTARARTHRTARTSLLWMTSPRV